MSQVDRLHLLSVDFERAGSAVRAAFELSRDQQADLLCQAVQHGVPLLLIRGQHSLDLFSTKQGHVRAFRPVLACLRERMGAAEDVSTVPVLLSRGGDAARYLVRRAVPFFGFEAEARQFAHEVDAGAAMAKACGSFDGELSALCRMVTRATERVRAETRLSYSDATSGELELDTLDAERIVEEELLSWQSTEPSLRASIHPPLSVPDFGPLGGAEPQSVTRLSAARVLTRLGSG